MCVLVHFTTVVLLACATVFWCGDSHSDADSLDCTNGHVISLLQNEILLQSALQRRHEESTILRSRLQDRVHQIENGSLPLDYHVPAMMWNGDDNDHKISFIQVPKKPSAVVHILGNMNSGTNLLRSLVDTNLADVEVLGGTMQDRSIHGRNALGGPCDFWKHAPLSLLQERQPQTLAACTSLHVKGLAIIRNPLAWLDSTKTKPYALAKCTAGEHWLTRPCSFPSCTQLPKTAQDHCYMEGANFSSVAAMWNAWIRDYDQLHKFGFDKGMIVRYEDLVLKPEETLTNIAEMLGTSTPHLFHHVNGIVSPFSQSHDRSGAIERIQTKSYLKAFTKPQLHDACSRLNQDLMLRHGYDDCNQI